MDCATFPSRLLGGEMESPAAKLHRLMPQEKALCDELREGSLRPGLRLEQERVRFGCSLSEHRCISVPFERFFEVKSRIEKRRQWQRWNADLAYFEMPWKPKSWCQRYRSIVVRRQVLVRDKGLRPHKHTGWQPALPELARERDWSQRLLGLTPGGDQSR